MQIQAVPSIISLSKNLHNIHFCLWKSRAWVRERETERETDGEQEKYFYYDFFIKTKHCRKKEFHYIKTQWYTKKSVYTWQNTKSVFFSWGWCASMSWLILCEENNKYFLFQCEIRRRNIATFFVCMCASVYIIRICLWSAFLKSFSNDQRACSLCDSGAKDCFQRM